MRRIYLRDLICKSVKETVAGSENPGVCLSGGMDSSTVMAFAQELPAFTGYYEGEPYDERKWARLARGREHHEILIQPHDFVDHFDDMLAAVAPPYTGPGMLGQYVVAKYAVHHVDTLLTGEGGDELFGGYARVIIVAGEKPPLGYEDYKLPEGYPTNLRVALELEFEALQNLLRVDAQIAGAFGLEVKTPLLHPEIVEWVIHQSPDARVGKRMLRQAMRGYVDNAILDRKDKRGFPVPFVDWAQREPVKSFVSNRIGYVPDPAKPWDRTWWQHLTEMSS